MDKVTVGVLIGRFQPIHVGHIHLIENALDKCDKLILIIGSDSEIRTTKNPFLTCERIDMIKLCFTFDKLDKIIICPLCDFNDDKKWADAVNKIVSDNSLTSDTIGLFGLNKDNSTYYLSLFPEYKLMLIEYSFGQINATDIRKQMYEFGTINPEYLHPEVCKYLCDKFKMDYEIPKDIDLCAWMVDPNSLNYF
jgi:bifunctional NMN adenylyltransferase/nudix hydrolase